MFSSLQELSEKLRATGYIADSVATTTVYLAAKLQSRSCSKAQRAAGRLNWHMQSQRRPTQRSSACSATRASVKRKQSANSMSPCKGFASN